MRATRWTPAAALLLLAPLPALAAAVATPPVPLTDEAQWLRPGDYPPEAMRAGQQGTISAVLTVDPHGAVSGCTIKRSSGYPHLDEATCRRIEAHARFRPATDAAGQPIEGQYPLHDIVWRLDDRSAVSPVTAPPAQPPAVAAPLIVPAPPYVDAGTPYAAPPAPAEAAKVNALVALMKSMGGAPLPEVAHVTPARLQQVAPLWDQLGLESAIRAKAHLAAEQFHRGLMSATPGLAQQQRARADADLQSAFAAAEAHSVAVRRARLLRFYAARLSDDDLRGLMPLIADGTVRKLAPPPSDGTAAERQAVGQSIIDHPVLAKLVKIELDYVPHMLADTHPDEVTLQGDTMSGFCRNLARDHLAMPACRAAK